jgi:hypothetical protein
MLRLFSLASLVFVMAVVGCSKPATTNIVDNADQAAIDAYNATIAAEEAAAADYKEPTQ